MLRSISVLLGILQLTLAVTVTVSNGVVSEVRQVCNNLLPGECCRALPVAFTMYFNPFNPGAVDFTGLLPLDVAAVWAARWTAGSADTALPGNIRGCSGFPIETRTGPGGWHYEATGIKRAWGASYVRLPAAVPPGQKEADWLTAEGMLGLVWGGGRWLAKGHILSGTGTSPGVKKKRGIVSAQKGKAYMTGPKRWKWPDVVEVNGTKYMDAGSVELLYQSTDGRVLNMTG